MFQQLQKMLMVLQRFPNRGNTVRDQLANERTFLAYMRGCICFMVVTVSTAQIFQKILIDAEVGAILHEADDRLDIAQYIYQKGARPFCILVCTIAILIAILGATRYYWNLHLLINDHYFRASQYSVGLIFLWSLAVSTIY